MCQVAGGRQDEITHPFFATDINDDQESQSGRAEVLGDHVVLRAIGDLHCLGVVVVGLAVIVGWCGDGRVYSDGDIGASVLEVRTRHLL
jgi:hypothetical protein